MRLKSFFAGSIEAALGLAREEMGPEAILVDSRKAPPEAQHLGEYEVVVAAMPDTHMSEKRTPSEKSPAEADRPQWQQLATELALLREQMERLRRAVWGSSTALPRGWPGFPQGRIALGTLLEAGLEPQLAHEIAACVEARLAGDPLLIEQTFANGEPSSAQPCENWLRVELERRIRTEPSLGEPGASQRAVALVGPPGSGKTLTLVKLAVRYGIEQRLPLLLISMDTYRPAGTEPLKTYAAILGVPFRPADTHVALGQALASLPPKGLALIDTPGLSPTDQEAMDELGEMLACFPQIEPHLTLASTTATADLTNAVDRFEQLRPAKLIFTRLDEASSFGPAFTQAARTGKPVSFLACGQKIPEDLREASPELMIRLLLERHPA